MSVSKKFLEPSRIFPEYFYKFQTGIAHEVWHIETFPLAIALLEFKITLQNVFEKELIFSEQKRPCKTLSIFFSPKSWTKT